MMKKFVKIVLVICIIALIVDLGLFMYFKNKSDSRRTFFNSLNSFVKYNNGYYGVGSTNVNKNSIEQAVLIRYDNNYNKISSKTLKTKYNGTYFDIKKDGDNVVVAGSYEKTKGDNKEGLRTALFIKYDKSGKIIFRKEMQHLGNSKYTKILVLDDGYVVVGQSIYANNVLGNEETGGGIITKYSKDGKVIWEKNYGGNKSGLFNDVILDKDKLVVVGKDAGRYGLIATYTLDGEQIKAVSYAKTDTLGFSSIVKYKGSYYVCGAKKLVEDDEYDHDIDGLIVKYNKKLKNVKEVKFKDEKKGLERFNKIIIDGKNLVVVGHESILDKEKSTKDKNEYYYNALINKYDGNLKLVTNSVYKKELDNYFTDIDIVDGNYLVSGYSKYKTNRYSDFFTTYSKDLK